MSAADLVSGGNVHDAKTTLNIQYLQYFGRDARDLNAFVRLARKQGVRITEGIYQYAWWRRTARALNVTFAGPVNAVKALEALLDSFDEDD